MKALSPNHWADREFLIKHSYYRQNDSLAPRSRNLVIWDTSSHSCTCCQESPSYSSPPFFLVNSYLVGQHRYLLPQQACILTLLGYMSNPRASGAPCANCEHWRSHSALWICSLIANPSLGPGTVRLSQYVQHLTQGLICSSCSIHTYAMKKGVLRMGLGPIPGCV